MTRRRRRLGLLLAMLLALAGCAHRASAPPKANLTTRGPFPSVTGQFGLLPTLNFAHVDGPSAKLQRKLLVTGAGPAVAVGDLVAVDYLGQIWNGKVFDDAYGGQATTLPVGVHKLPPGLDAGLIGVPVGSRVLLTVPPADGYGTAGKPSEGIRPSDTLVFVVDIAKRFNGKSGGEVAATPVAEPAGLPVVGGTLGVAPTITFPPHHVLPSRRTTVVTARGHGPALVQGSAVIQYYSVDWAGKFVGSTWLTGTPTSVPVGAAEQATGGLFDDLVGLPIGSRVLIVAPAPAGPKQASDTAVVAVDILDQVASAQRMTSDS